MLSKFFKKMLLPRAVDIHTGEIYLIIISVCFTFAEPFVDIFLFVKSSCVLVSGIQTKVYDPRKD